MVYKPVSNNKQQDTQRRALTKQNKESALVINSVLLLFLFAFIEKKKKSPTPCTGIRKDYH